MGDLRSPRQTTEPLKPKKQKARFGPRPQIGRLARRVRNSVPDAGVALGFLHFPPLDTCAPRSRLRPLLEGVQHVDGFRAPGHIEKRITGISDMPLHFLSLRPSTPSAHTALPAATPHAILEPGRRLLHRVAHRRPALSDSRKQLTKRTHSWLITLRLAASLAEFRRTHPGDGPAAAGFSSDTRIRNISSSRTTTCR